MSLRQRTPTAVVLLGATFAVIQFAPDWAFFLFGQVFILGALLELFKLAERSGLKPQRALGVAMALLVSLTFFVRAVPLEAALYAGLLASAFYFVISINTMEKLAHFPASFAVTFLGPLYIAFPLSFLFWVRTDFGPYLLYYLGAVIFLGDTGGYFIGKPFGRRKMTPIASPNKTWEGSAGGFLFALGGAVLAWFVLPMAGIPLWKAAASGLVIHAAAQVSDPLESLFKRAAGVKDSSNSLPGHGGFLDRIDSLILAGPLLYYVARYFWR